MMHQIPHNKENIIVRTKVAICIVMFLDEMKNYQDICLRLLDLALRHAQLIPLPFARHEIDLMVKLPSGSSATGRNQ